MVRQRRGSMVAEEAVEDEPEPEVGVGILKGLARCALESATGPDRVRVEEDPMHVQVCTDYSTVSQRRGCYTIAE